MNEGKPTSAEVRSESDSSSSGVNSSQRSQKPKVIYLMGAGHSGSTILGVTLNNCAGFFYAGELEEWLIRSGQPKFGGAERTRFWEQVRARIDGANELFGTDARDCIERSSAIFRIDRWPTRSRIRRQYRRLTGELYRAVADIAGVSCVVDSSHFPLRARELQKVDGIELYLVFLVRDADGVVGSELATVNRHAPVERARRVLTKNLDLWLTYLLSVAVFLRQPHARRIFVRHEEFLARPETILCELLRRFGSPAGPPDFSALATGMPLQGNNLLWSDVVSLKGEPVKRAARGGLTSLLQAPWARVFERLRPAARPEPQSSDVRAERAAV